MHEAWLKNEYLYKEKCYQQYDKPKPIQIKNKQKCSYSIKTLKTQYVCALDWEKTISTIIGGRIDIN